MRQLSGLAHEYTAVGVLGPIQLIGRRRVEYPLVQDTVTLSPPLEVISFDVISLSDKL